MSVIIQPLIESSFWLMDLTDNEIEYKLMLTAYPIYTEVKSAIQACEALVSSGKTTKPVDAWAFGTEMSVLTNIPHYQCWLKFPVLIRKSSVYEFFKKKFMGRCHVVVDSVFGSSYRDYCLKDSSKFNFGSKYYWNVKLSSIEGASNKIRLKDLRSKLKVISENYYSGQKLLKEIVMTPAGDRTIFWITDVIGGTGKTAFFQTIVDDPESPGVYLRVSEGQERLSAKLRKKIKARLESGENYPDYVWVNFGRTVTEGGLQTISDFGEQIVDGMLDDNFGNTAGKDFMPLPYMNLVITANTPPNMSQMTDDRLKLLTFFPKYLDGRLVDTFLVPIFIEINVRFVKQFPFNFDYRYKVRLQSDDYIEKNFKCFPWYESLKDQVLLYRSFSLKSDLKSDWRPITSRLVQEDIKAVHNKALRFASTMNFEGSNRFMVEASSFYSVKTKYYEYREGDHKLNFWEDYFVLD